jgi:hypothetical protein
MEWLITTANHNLPNLKLIVGEHRGRSSLQGVPILIPPATLAMWRAYAAETDVTSLCGREATSVGNLARSVCSRID